MSTNMSEHQPSCDLNWQAPELKPSCSCPEPLHVQVARALGWTYVGPSEVEGGYEGEPPVGHPMKDYPRRLDQHIGIPHYDTDWSATGPLVEKYLMWLSPCRHDKTLHWSACSELNDFDDPECEGETALVAACNLIIALSQQGRLRE